MTERESDPLFDALRERLETHQRPPAAGAWPALAAQLAAHRRRQRRRRAGWALGGLLVLLTVAGPVTIEAIRQPLQALHVMMSAAESVRKPMPPRAEGAEPSQPSLRTGAETAVPVRAPAQASVGDAAPAQTIISTAPEPTAYWPFVRLSQVEAPPRAGFGFADARLKSDNGRLLLPGYSGDSHPVRKPLQIGASVAQVRQAITATDSSRNKQERAPAAAASPLTTGLRALSAADRMLSIAAPVAGAAKPGRNGLAGSMAVLKALRRRRHVIAAPLNPARASVAAKLVSGQSLPRQRAATAGTDGALLRLRAADLQLDTVTPPRAVPVPVPVADSAHPAPLRQSHWSISLALSFDGTHRRLTGADADPLARIERAGGAGQAAVSVGYALGPHWRLVAGVGYAAYRQTLRAALVRTGTALAYVEQTVTGASGQPVRTLSWQWVSTDSVVGRQTVRTFAAARYLTVPLGAEWLPRRPAPRWQPVLSAGLTPHILLSARAATLTSACACETAPAALRRFALGLSAGAGLDYALWPDLWLSVRPAATYLLTNTATAGAPARHPWRAGLAVGLRWTPPPRAVR